MVGADRTINQVSELVFFSDHSRGKRLEGLGSPLQGLRFWRQKSPSEPRKAKTLEQRAHPRIGVREDRWPRKGGFSSSGWGFWWVEEAWKGSDQCVNARFLRKAQALSFWAEPAGVGTPGWSRPVFPLVRGSGNQLKPEVQLCS